MPYYSPPKSTSLCTFGILVTLVLDSVLGWCFTYKWMLLSSFWGKIDHKTCVATQNLYILKNVTFWPDLDLKLTFWPQSMAVTPKQMSEMSSLSKTSLKTCVAWYSIGIWILWPLVTWPWHDLDLILHDMNVGVSQYLSRSISVIFKDYGAHRFLRSALNSRRLKAPILTFDLDLTLPLTLTSDFFACFELVSMRPFHRRIVFENRTVSLGVSQGGRKTPPPPSQWCSAQTPVNGGLTTRN